MRLIITIIGIIAIFLIPVDVISKNVEESTDETRALLLNSSQNVILHVTNVPKRTKKITLHTGDTLRAPLSTEIRLDINNESSITTLAHILKNERDLAFKAKPDKNNAITIQLSTPNLDPKTSLVIRTQQKDTLTPAYSLHENRPLISVVISALYKQNLIAGDIQYVWEEGASILSGHNPYARAGSGSLKNNKYATYFPLAYIGSAAIQKLGFSSFEDWLLIARPVIYVSQLVTAIIVALVLLRQKKNVLAVIAFFAILFHRFTIYPALVSHIDFPAILFLVVGMALLTFKPRLGYISIGISLAIKQMAIFLVPLFMISAYQKNKSFKNLVISIMLIGCIPTLSFLPFVVTSPLSVIHSILFSTRRISTSDFTTPDVSTLVHLEDFSARIGMIALMILVYTAFWKKEIRLYSASLLIFTIFIGFNPVLFYQYLAWLVPFILLAMSANYKSKHTEPHQEK